MRRLSPALLAALAVSSLAVRPSDAADDAPKIRALIPSFATRGQTVDVTMEGSNLAPFDEVKCGRQDVALTAEKSTDPHKVKFRLVIPDTAVAGPVPITIKTKTGVASTEKFQVRLRTPVVSKVKPDGVQRGGESDLLVTGINLGFLGQDTQVSVEPPITATLTGKPTDKALTVHLVVPANVPPGPKSLLLSTTDGKVTANFFVTLAPPEIATVTPASVARGASAEVKLAGKNLGGVGLPVLAMPDPAFTYAAVGAASPTGLSLKVTVAPEAAPGPRLLVFATSDGLAVARIEVTTPPPTLRSVLPAGAARGTTVDLDLLVENVPGAYVLRVLPVGSGVVIERPKVGKPKLTVAADALPGTRTLLIEHPFGLHAIPFTVNLKGPGVTGVAPAEVAPGAAADVTVEGERLEGVEITLAVPDPDLTVTPGKTPGTVHVVAGAHAKPGPRSLLVRTADGAASAILSVTGPAPSAPVISSLVPLRAPRGAATSITLKGSNLRAEGDKAPDVSFRAGTVAVPVKIVASTPSSLTVEVSPPAESPLGGWALVVATPEGAAAGALAVVPATPSLAPLEPVRLARPGAVKVALQGTFLAAPGGGAPTVALTRADGSGGLVVQVDAATSGALALTVVLDATTPTGAYVLSVTTSEGGVALPVTVVPAVPEITSIEPSTLGSPANVTFAVKGRNLVGPDGKAVQVAVTRLGSAASVNPQVLSAAADALSVRVITQKGTPPGPHVLVVTTPDGRAAGVFRVVDVPMPAISSVEPATASPLSTVTVVLKGSGLLGTSQVAFSGAGVVAQIVPGGTDTDMTLRVTVAKDAAPGVRTLTVTAPGGVTVAATGFAVK